MGCESRPSCSLSCYSSSSVTWVPLCLVRAPAVALKPGCPAELPGAAGSTCPRPAAPPGTAIRPTRQVFAECLSGTSCARSPGLNTTETKSLASAGPRLVRRQGGWVAGTVWARMGSAAGCHGLDLRCGTGSLHRGPRWPSLWASDPGKSSRLPTWHACSCLG